MRVERAVSAASLAMLALATALSSLLVSTQAKAANDDFGDIAGNAHAGFIRAVAAAGIAGGYADNTYRPEAPVTRAQMATFLTRALDLTPVPAPFSDTRNSNHERSIGAVAAAGIAGGYADNTYRPDAPVTRAQMATFLGRALGLPPIGAERVQHATFPTSHRHQIPGPTGFYWHGGNPEIAQSVLLPHAFELSAVQIGVVRLSILENWRTADPQQVSYDHETHWSGTVRDHDMRVSIWRGPASAFGEQVDLRDLVLVTDQPVRADLPVSGQGGTQTATLRLPQPVGLEAGHHLISLSSYGLGPSDLLTIFVWGRDNGANNRPGMVLGTCRFEPGTDSYPHGRAYTRNQGEANFPREAFDRSLASPIFVEHVAKASSVSGNCDPGREDHFNPGDLELALLGR